MQHRQALLLAELRDEAVKSAVSCGFMPAVGSSSSRSFGWVASARATSSRRWSPYERLLRELVVATAKAAEFEQLRARAPALALLLALDAGRPQHERTIPPESRECIPTSVFSSAVMLLEEADVLERSADPALGDGVRRLGGHVVAVEDDLPGGRLVDAGQHVEEGRLAGAVGADQADDRPFAGS